MNDRTASQPEGDDALDRALAALPRERAPAHDLWPALEAQLVAQAPAPRARPWRYVAAAMVAALSILLVIPERETPPFVADERSHGDALSLLLATYEAQKGAQLATLAQTTPAITRQLALWDGAIAQVKGALLYYPDEPALLRQLDGLYQQQLHYLERIALSDPHLIAYY